MIVDPASAYAPIPQETQTAASARPSLGWVWLPLAFALLQVAAGSLEVYVNAFHDQPPRPYLGDLFLVAVILSGVVATFLRRPWGALLLAVVHAAFGLSRLSIIGLVVGALMGWVWFCAYQRLSGKRSA